MESTACVGMPRDGLSPLSCFSFEYVRIRIADWHNRKYLLSAISTGIVGYFVSGQVAEFSKLIKWSALNNCVGLLGIAYVWGMTIPKKKWKFYSPLRIQS